MAGGDTVRLLDAEPDLGRFLTADDRAALDGLSVPVLALPAGDLDLPAALADQRAFGFVLLDGLVAHRLVVGDAQSLRLLGPGDLLSVSSTPRSSQVLGSGWRVAAPTRMAVLGREVLLAAHRAPRLVAGLHVREAEQIERVAVQLTICQLPRVEDRVLSLLWLLAESWGHVTATGTALRLHLTHETIGQLIGGRRSTVTLALRKLTDDGALLRSDGGWVLLAPPARVEREPVPAGDPQLSEAAPGRSGLLRL